ncbi:MAG TPA: sigma factor-like helix-turn-helix DNA-binding protein, partial [Paludibacter sp.]|nr:sigma factor-like helix-turn-helix DNA-binding protein [Paludibacter sp.]
SIVNDKFEAEQLSRQGDTDNIEEALFAKELESLIEIAVCQMPAQRKLIYTMSRIEGVSNGEIAERLHLNKRTVENHLTAALANVRKMVKQWPTLFL